MTWTLIIPGFFRSFEDVLMRVGLFETSGYFSIKICSIRCVLSNYKSNIMYFVMSTKPMISNMRQIGLLGGFDLIT